MTTKTRKRWSESDLQKLAEAVATESSKQAAFRKVAAETGRDLAAVQQKWYTLPTNKNKAAPKKQMSKAFRFGAMSIEQLARVSADLRKEIEERKKELDQILS